LLSIESGHSPDHFALYLFLLLASFRCSDGVARAHFPLFSLFLAVTHRVAPTRVCRVLRAGFWLFTSLRLWLVFFFLLLANETKGASFPGPEQETCAPRPTVAAIPS